MKEVWIYILKFAMCAIITAILSHAVCINVKINHTFKDQRREGYREYDNHIIIKHEGVK